MLVSHAGGAVTFGRDRPGRGQGASRQARRARRRARRAGAAASGRGQAVRADRRPVALPSGLGTRACRRATRADDLVGPGLTTRARHSAPSARSASRSRDRHQPSCRLAALDGRVSSLDRGVGELATAGLARWVPVRAPAVSVDRARQVSTPWRSSAHAHVAPAPQSSASRSAPVNQFPIAPAARTAMVQWNWTGAMRPLTGPSSVGSTRNKSTRTSTIKPHQEVDKP